jgi:hypothetical protein
MQLCGWWWAGGSEAELVTLLARYTPPEEIVWFRMLATCATHSCNDAHFAVRLDEKLDGQESKSSSRVRELEQLKKRVRRNRATSALWGYPALRLAACANPNVSKQRLDDSAWEDEATSS